MTAMLNKIRTATWFIKNPNYIPQIFQVIKRNRNPNLEHSLPEATAWCKENCMSQEKALTILLDNTEVDDFEMIYFTQLKQAREVADSCPVKMGGEGAIGFLYNLVRHSNSMNILETGVAYGWSSLAILLAIKNRDNAKLISNDMPYVNMNNEDYVGCVIPGDLKGQWELQRLPDITGIPIALKKFKNSIDFCHYDSDKSYSGRMWSSPIIWNALKKNGIFVVDDINDNLAFKHFCSMIYKEPLIIKHQEKYVGVLVK